MKQNFGMKALIIMVCILSGLHSEGRDNLKLLAGYAPLKGYVVEHSLTIGLLAGKHHLITISPGYTHDNPIVREFFCGLSPSQDEYPFLVYKGPVIRAAYEFRFYEYLIVGGDLFYKHLSYSGHTFLDSEGDHGGVKFTRDEISTVYGWHINIGLLVHLMNAHVFLNPSMGFGKTYKQRTYTTTGSEPVWPAYYSMPLGTYKRNLQYFSFFPNFTVGFVVGK
jgi:hypothetical protein